MKQIILFSVIALIAVSASTAFSGEPSAAVTASDQAAEFTPPMGSLGEVRGPGADENARKRIEIIRISRLTEALNLDEKTAAVFIPAITLLEQNRREIRQRHRQAVRELRRGVHSDNENTSQLKKTIDAFTASQREMMNLREKEFETARKYLTTGQLARYLIFQQDFFREIRELVSGMQRGDRGRHGAGRRQGMTPDAGHSQNR